MGSRWEESRWDPSNKEDRRRFKSSYVEAHRRAMKVLYEEDPQGFGISIGAPADEYSAQASELLVELSRMGRDDEIESLIRREFPEASGSLVNQLSEIWRDYSVASP